MNERQLTAISEINTIARKLQNQTNRVYYYSRIIEFLVEIIREPTNSSINRLVIFVDTTDKSKYSLFLDMDYEIKKDN